MRNQEGKGYEPRREFMVARLFKEKGNLNCHTGHAQGDENKRKLAMEWRKG